MLLIGNYSCCFSNWSRNSKKKIKIKIKIKKIHASGTTTLIISNEKMNDLMKTVQALEDSDTLLKGVTKIIKNEIKK